MLMEKKEYDLDFSAKQWEEIECLGFDGFQPMSGEPLLRCQWIAIADLALGKAQRIEEGDFGDGMGMTADDDAIWAAELRGIAAAILRKFKPGDGQV